MPKTLLHRLSFLIPVLLTLSGCSITHAMRVADHEIIGVESMIDEIRNTPVILVGERHDSSSHHKLQLQVIAKLKEDATPFAIGMEMFETTSQKALDAWSAGKVPEAAFKKVFEWNWRNIRWELYEDILLFARDNRIPLIALNAPREIVQKVAQRGASSLTSEELCLLPPDIRLDVSEHFLDFMRAAYPVHGGGGAAFRTICEAQLLRNRVMARQVSDYLALHPGSKVVVLAGGGHARKEGGIPEELGELRYRIVLPNMPGLDTGSVTKKDGDYLLVEPYSWLDTFF